MLEIPIQPVPNQSLTVVVNQINCKINLNTRTKPNYFNLDLDLEEREFVLYFDLEANSSSITRATICENLTPLIKQDYLGFSGNFIFVDLEGDSNPFYEGLGSRFRLLYLENLNNVQLF